jgi:hypothetical protein
VHVVSFRIIEVGEKNMYALRVIYQGIHSKSSGDLLATDYVNWTVLRVTSDSISSNSIVLVSASQCSIDADTTRVFTPVIERFVGHAPITVRNIAPQDGFVEFWIYVDWEKPVDIAVDLVVLDPPTWMVVVDSDFQNQETYQVDTRPQNKQAVASAKPSTKIKPSTKRRHK